MKNPLNKRLPKEFVGELGKYLVIFLFMTATIGFISGFLVAGHSMIAAYNESFGKYNIEHGNFSLNKEPSNTLLEKVEKEHGTIYKDYYKDEEADADGDGEVESTIRIFINRTEVNKVCLMEGALPEKENEIAIDRMYADNNGVRQGDKLLLGGKEVTVTGLVALSDYSALFSDNNDMMFDSVKFGVAVMTKEGYETFPKEHQIFHYNWKYKTEPKDDVEEKEMSEKFAETLATEVYRAGIELKTFIPRFSNQAIQFTGDDMGGDKTMMIVLLYILIVILAFVFSITLSHTITKEATVIGTLRASGYTRGELYRHYIATPLIVTLCAAIVGNILGYTCFKEIVVGMYYGSYSLPTFVTLWNGEAFVLTTVVPFLIMLIFNSITLWRKLKLSPLKFIRRDLNKKKNKKAVRLPHFKFFTRFRIRIIFQNLSGYITMFVGIFFASVLLIFGMLMGPLLSNYQDKVVEDMLCKYQYVLKTQVETKQEGAEQYCMTSLVFHGDMREEDISIYGIAKNSRYLKEKLPSDGITISENFAQKYKLGLGDTCTLYEKYENKKYSFRVAKIIDYAVGLAVFMPQDNFNKCFEKKADMFDMGISDPALLFHRLASPEEMTYFTGYFSDEEITDIDEKYIASCITEEDMTKISRQLDVSMGTMFEMVKVFAVVLAVLLIYLLTKLILEKNTTSISMVKILGYENKEIAALYLATTSIIVAISVIGSLFLATIVILMIYRILMMNFNGWITCYLAPGLYPQMVLMILVAYAFVAWLQFKKIKKVPMDEALKNVE
ncbi:MAG: ABC transporter permease [Lachnospiraceae bacterium]|nr:ABC transporter permease [Lachnospiraceae bacterium]